MAAIFENNKIDKKKSQHNVLHHGIFQDEKILEMISSLLLEHKSKTWFCNCTIKKKKPYERPDKPRPGFRVAILALYTWYKLRGAKSSAKIILFELQTALNGNYRDRHAPLQTRKTTSKLTVSRQLTICRNLKVSTYGQIPGYRAD